MKSPRPAASCPPRRQLGSSINVQRSTMQQPALFFGVLLAFAAELDGAHQENAAADASPGSSTQKKVGCWVAGCACSPLLAHPGA
jgi:hypothetical protein